MTFLKPKIKWQYKKYLLVANDITNTLLHKEKRQEDKRARKLMIALIILGVVLIVSLVFNVYLVQGV